jgi:hypothetical protein
LVLLYLLQQYGFNLLLFYKNDLIQGKKKHPHITTSDTLLDAQNLESKPRMRMRTLDMQNLEHEATK